MRIKFTWIGGATWILDIEGMRIACDPVLCPAGTIQNYILFSSKRLNEPVFTDTDFQDIDLWLITHGHEDHLDQAGVAHIQPGATVITHQNALKKLQKAGLQNITVLRWGENRFYDIKGKQVSIEAIPAIHGVNPLVARLAGGVNGYWITVENPEHLISFYATGDTVLHKNVLRPLEGCQVDVLIPNMGAVKQNSWLGPLTMSAGMLQEFMTLLQPKHCIPVHFGTFEHYVEPISEVEEQENNAIIILQPGQMYTIDHSEPK